MPLKCAAINISNGKRCSKCALEGSNYCYVHRQSTEKVIKEPQTDTNQHIDTEDV